MPGEVKCRNVNTTNKHHMITIQPKQHNSIPRVGSFVTGYGSDYNRDESSPFETRGIVDYDDDTRHAKVDAEREKLHERESVLRGDKFRRIKI